MATVLLQQFKQRLRFVKLIRVPLMPIVNLRYSLRDVRYAKSADADRIRELKNAFAGKRCFIVGNGPSLTCEDLDKLKNEYTFAANGIYKLFDRTDWRPYFYVSIDYNALELETDCIKDLKAQYKFLDITSKPKYDGRENVVYINSHKSRFTADKFTTATTVFSEAPDRCIGAGYTVTFTALQLALYMGFTEIYLIGMDHSYKNRVSSNGAITSDKNVAKDHFFDRADIDSYYFFDGVEYAYRLSRDYADSHGVQIRNATRGGFLEIFEREDFDELFARDIEA